jgi:RimJ/RimL family protein N-acetyltransferase
MDHDPLSNRYPTLHGRLVRLEPLSTDHLEGLRAHTRQPEIWRYVKLFAVDRPDGIDEWVARILREARTGTSFPFAIIERARGVVAGTTSLYDHVARMKRVTIGHTWLGVEHWGRAINSEAKYLALRHGFETLGVNRVQATVDVENLRSRRALEKLSFREEGVLRSFLVRPGGRTSDVALYSLLRSEWAPVKARLEALVGESSRGAAR